MKVKQLIEELSKLDPELDVFVSDNEWGPRRVGKVPIEKPVTIRHMFKEAEVFPNGGVVL